MRRARLAAAAVVAAALLTSLAWAHERTRPRVLLRYTRSGGVAGVREEMIVYEDGRAVLTSGGMSSGGDLPEGLVSALRIVIRGIGGGGVVGPPPAEGAADFFTHELDSPDLGVSVRWVDPWASGGRLPDEIIALDHLISYARAYLLGWEAGLSDASSSGGMTLEVWIERPWASPGDEVSIQAEFSNGGPEAVSYEVQTPCHPDVALEPEGGGAQVIYTHPSYDPAAPCAQVVARREVPPGGTVVNSAVLKVTGPSGRIVWIRASLAGLEGGPEVRVPLVVTG